MDAGAEWPVDGHNRNPLGTFGVFMSLIDGNSSSTSIDRLSPVLERFRVEATLFHGLRHPLRPLPMLKR